MHWASGVPHALFGRKIHQRLGRLARRDANVRLGAVRLDVIASAAKQSILSLRLDGLLRGAWHRARIRATRWLAMTVSKNLRDLAV